MLELNRSNIAKAVAGLTVLLIGYNSVKIVPNGYTGVVSSFGHVQDSYLKSGINFIPPWMKVQEVDIATHKQEVQMNVATSDLQQVTTVITVQYSFDPDKTVNLVREYRNPEQILDRVIVPTIVSGTKTLTSGNTVEDLIKNRETLRLAIEVNLKNKLATAGVIVHDLQVVDFKFSKKYQDAVDDKMVAQQAVVTSKLELERAQVQAQQVLVAAKAQADAQAMLKQSATSEVIKLKELEVQKEAISKWNGVLPNVTGGSIPMIDVAKLK